MQTLIRTFVIDNPDWSTRTRAWYERRLIHFDRFMRQYQLTPTAIAARQINLYLGELRAANLSWSTRNGAYTILSHFFKWLKTNQIIKHNPFGNLDTRPRRPRKTRRVIKPVPLGYMRQMIAAAQNSHNLFGVRDTAIMYLLATTGMRREELVNLTLPGLNLDQNTIFIVGKGQHERLSFIRDDTRRALKQWLRARPRCESTAVFISLHPNKRTLHSPLRPDAINDLLIKWRNRAKLPPISVSPHKWRHAFATAVARGGNPFALQYLMGHADISTTKIYVHPDDDELKRLITGYGPKI